MTEYNFIGKITYYREPIFKVNEPINFNLVLISSEIGYPPVYELII
jgi:hypothetical protein